MVEYCRTLGPFGIGIWIGISFWFWFWFRSSFWFGIGIGIEIEVGLNVSRSSYTFYRSQTLAFTLLHQQSTPGKPDGRTKSIDSHRNRQSEPLLL